MNTIIWTDKAKTAYLGLLIFLKEAHSQKTILKLSNDVQKCIDRVQLLPKLYPIINETLNIRRCVLSKNASLSYLYNENTQIIYIIRVWDNRQGKS
jgi:plasmid stabilization system protein ParE